MIRVAADIAISCINKFGRCPHGHRLGPEVVASSVPKLICPQRSPVASGFRHQAKANPPAMLMGVYVGCSGVSDVLVNLQLRLVHVAVIDGGPLVRSM